MIRLLGDPTEVALIEMARRALPGQVLHPRVDEVPFDSDRKRLSTLHRTDEGLVLFTKGALAALLPLCGSSGQPLPSGDRRTLAGRGRSHGKRRPSRPGPGVPARVPNRTTARAWKRI